MDVIRKFFAATFLVAVLSIPSIANAAFIVEGTQEVYSFDASIFSEITTESYDAASLSISFANTFATGGLDDPFFYSGNLDSGESIQVDFYENEGDAIPFESHVLEGEMPEISWNVHLWYDFLNDGSAFVPWTDLEGSIVFTALSGEVELNAPSLIISVDGNQYNASLAVTTVPLPAAVWLFGSGLIGLIGIAKRKKA